MKNFTSNRLSIISIILLSIIVYLATLYSMLGSLAFSLQEFDGEALGQSISRSILDALSLILPYPLLPIAELLNIGNGLLGHVILFANSIIWAVALFFLFKFIARFIKSLR